MTKPIITQLTQAKVKSTTPHEEGWRGARAHLPYLGLEPVSG